MKRILFIIGSLSLINVIILPFVSNFNVGFILQGIVSVAVLTYAFFFNKIKRSLHIAIFVVCIIPIIFISFLAIYGNYNNAKYDEDVVIILGAGIHGEQISATLARRLDKAVAYYSKNPESVIIVSGGQGPQEDITEALAMERYLIDKGIPKDIIIKEEQSTSTYENFIYSKKILDDHFPKGFSCVFITTDYHVYRAARTAEYAGLSAKHISAHTKWYIMPANYLREMLAVIRIWIMSPY